MILWFYVLVHCSGACLRWSLRVAWDKTLFNWLIRRHGQVPSRDSWVATRVAGPGLATAAAVVLNQSQYTEVVTHGGGAGSTAATKKLTSRSRASRLTASSRAGRTASFLPAIDRSPPGKVGVGTKQRAEGDWPARSVVRPFYFQIQPPQALAALEAFLLWEEMVAFEEQAKRIVTAPIEHYK
jgi:hypothetical protein